MSTEGPSGALRTPQLSWALPVLVASTVGSLWILGALVKASQLSDAGISAVDALQVVPMEQLLALGVGVVLDARVVLIGLGVAVAVGVLSAHRDRQRAVRRGITKPPLRTRDYTLFGATAALMAIFYSIVIAMGVAVALAILVLRQRVPRVRALGDWSGVAMVFVLGLLTATADYVVTPNPLPVAALNLEDERSLTGPLVASTGSTWFVGTTAGRFEGIPTARVRAAQIEHVARPDRPRLWPAIRSGLRWFFDLY